MSHRTATLIETTNGWLWAERDRTYTALVRACRVIAKEDAARAATFGACTTVIVYRPTTRAGHTTVKAITR